MNNKKYMSIGLSGGVSNNQLLRDQMKQYASTVGTEVLFAEPRHSGDNATMIAFAAHIDGGNTWSNLEQELCFNPSLKLDNLVG
jgi:N6-L-threonylcarbamoyladenine synthase